MADPTQLNMDKKDKPHVGVVVVGHVDAGKSTTTGHLLFKLGTMDERAKAALQAEADQKGKGSFAFAFFMDKQKEERDRGVTISCTTKEFHTTHFHYTIIDAPGHKDFIKNMISGSSQADVALLMVPASPGKFETAIQKGEASGGDKSKAVKGQTRHHAELTALLGIKQLIIGVNKMDASEPAYSEDRFKEIKKYMLSMVKASGWKTEGKKVEGKKKGPNLVPVIPISGFQGDNLIEASTKMSWFKGWTATTPTGRKIKGKTLFEAFDQFVEAVSRQTDKPLRMPISGCFKMKAGTIVTGRIEQGVLDAQVKTKTGMSGQEVVFYPSGLNAKVFSIEAHHRQMPQAVAGDNIGICVKGLPKDRLPAVGEILALKSDTTMGKTADFTATIKVQEHPGQLKVGYTPLVLVRTAKSACKISALKWKITKANMKVVKKAGKKAKQVMEDVKEHNPKFIKAGDTAQVIFEPMQPMAVSAFSDCEGLGRIAVLESNSLVMLGKINSTTNVAVKLV